MSEKEWPVVILVRGSESDRPAMYDANVGVFEGEEWKRYAPAADISSGPHQDRVREAFNRCLELAGSDKKLRVAVTRLLTRCDEWRLSATQPEAKLHRDALLAAIDAHRNEWDETSRVKGPDQQTEPLLRAVWEGDQRLYRAAGIRAAQLEEQP
jgi:hypothetical protein